MEEIKILSVQDCHDEDYGASQVQYQVGSDCVLFAFSDIPADKLLIDPTQFLEEAKAHLQSYSERPLWSDLSKELLAEIQESFFDMHFIEYDDENWSDELADQIWEEADKHNLSGVITRGEDGCYLTFYAGAMNEVNWNGHPLYGKPYFRHNIVEISQAVENQILKSGIRLDHLSQWSDLNFRGERIKYTTERDPRLDDLFQYLSANNLHGKAAYDYVGNLTWLSDAFNSGKGTFNDNKMFLMLEGFECGLTAEQVSLYAYPSYSASQMSFMLEAFKDDIPAPAMKFMIQHSNTGQSLIKSIGEYARLSQGLEAMEIISGVKKPPLNNLIQSAAARTAGAQPDAKEKGREPEPER